MATLTLTPKNTERFLTECIALERFGDKRGSNCSRTVADRGEGSRSETETICVRYCREETRTGRELG